MGKVICFLKENAIIIFIIFIVLVLILVCFINIYDSVQKNRQNPFVSSSDLFYRRNISNKNYICVDCNTNIIPDDSFVNCKTLKRIDFRGNISYLGKNVFSGCTNLEEINFYGKLEYYESDVFNNLSSLKRLSINEINIIQSNSFANLSNLEYVSIKNGLEIIEEGAFKNCNKLQTFRLPLPVPIIKEETIINSDYIEFIYPNYHKIKCGQMVFWNNSFIKSLIIPNNLKTLSEWMFAFCTNLEYVEIPDSVSKINKYCFSACQNIKEIKYYSNFQNFKSIYPFYNLELNSNCRIRTTDYPNGKTVEEMIIENEKYNKANGN